jgi:hypothetical protein
VNCFTRSRTRKGFVYFFKDFVRKNTKSPATVVENPASRTLSENKKAKLFYQLRFPFLKFNPKNSTLTINVTA